MSRLLATYTLGHERLNASRGIGCAGMLGNLQIGGKEGLTTENGVQRTRGP